MKRLYKHKDVLLIVSDHPDITVGPTVVRKNEMNRVRVFAWQLTAQAERTHGASNRVRQVQGNA